MNQNSDLKAFVEKRKQLADCITDISSIVSTIQGGEERGRQLLSTRDRLMQDAFRLMIVGEFKRGKSTLINSLLGDSILPAKVAPCTAIITEVSYGDTPKAVLHYNDKTKEPMEVDPQKLREYVIINDDDSDDDDNNNADKSIRESPYSFMELRYPLELCRNNVQLVDSPGLNEHKTRTKVALDFLDKADALVMVLSCQQALSESELKFIKESLRDRNLDHVFFVWNHYDAVSDSPDDIDDIQKRSRKYLESRVGSKKRIFYVSARDALRGKKRADEQLLERSQILPFEKALETFLGTERGRIKLLRPLQMCESAVRDAAFDLIPRAEHLLAAPLDKLYEDYQQQVPKLKEVEDKRERMLRSVERHRDALVRDSISSYRRFVGDVEIRIKEEAKNIDVSTLEATIGGKKIKEHIAQHLQSWLEQQYKTWSEKELQVVIEQRVEHLEQDVEQQATEFTNLLEEVRQALTPTVGIPDNESDISGANRVLSAVGGFFIGGIGSAIEGASMGFKGMAKGLGVNILAGTVLIMTGVGLPVAVAVLASIGIVRSLMGAKSKADKLRDEVVESVLKELRNNINDTSVMLQGSITEKFDAIRDNLDASLRIRIEEVAGQVQNILRMKKLGEEHEKQEKQKITEARQALSEFATQLQKIRHELDYATE